MAREDLNPVDEARACAALVEDLGLSKEELARRLGRSRVAISNLIRLLDLPDDVLDLLAAGRAQRGPRPGDPPGPRRRGAPRARSRGRGARLVGARDRAPRQGRSPPASASEGRPPPRPGGRAGPRRGGARVGARARACASAPLAAGSAPSSTSTTWTSSSPSPGSASPAADRPLRPDAPRPPLRPTWMPSCTMSCIARSTCVLRSQPLEPPAVPVARVAKAVVEAAAWPCQNSISSGRTSEAAPERRARHVRRPRTVSSASLDQRRRAPRGRAAARLWGEAQAPICESRGRAREVLVRLGLGQPLHRARGPAPGGRARASRRRARRACVASSCAAFADSRLVKKRNPSGPKPFRRTMRASGAPSASTVARVIASASGTSPLGALVPVAELLDRVAASAERWSGGMSGRRGIGAASLAIEPLPARPAFYNGPARAISSVG